MLIVIVVIMCAILIYLVVGHKEHYILLSEVIPRARIISQEEGIIEYDGVQYILGTHGLKKKKHLIESLNLLALEDSFIVDLRFNKQIIIKTIKKEPKSKKLESGSKKL